MIRASLRRLLQSRSWAQSSRTARVWIFLLSSSLVCLGQSSPILITDAAESKVEGRALAHELLAQTPAQNTTMTGVLKIRDGKGKRTEIPVRLQTLVTATNWQTSYFTQATNKENAASFTVIHTDNQPNRYRLATLARSPNQTNECIELTGNQAMIPFAGSDFWLADLGLEFFHWPEQRVVKKEMRRSQFCKMLESINPKPVPGSYSRVVSWIDHDSLGIIHAEAYDSNNKLLKEFDPKDFEKVEGQWQVHEIEIRNCQTDSRTRLEFNLEKH